MAGIAIETELNADESRQMYAGLMATDPVGRPRNFTPLTLVLRDDAGVMVGVLTGAIIWQWLSVEVLWVAESVRGQGHGAALMRRAEMIALERGCHHARLDTFDFQARPFYERLGYAVYGSLKDFPEGHTQFHLCKALERPGTTPVQSG
jgi:GNAT superfamily N-acetyltransferase